MTGPEHFKEAERLLVEAGQTTSPQDATQLAAQARVHAMLAETARRAAADAHFLDVSEAQRHTECWTAVVVGADLPELAGRP